jgi:hypothetical protein
MRVPLVSWLAAAAVTAALVACDGGQKIVGIRAVHSIDIETLGEAREPGDTVVVRLTAKAPGVGSPLPGVDLRLSVTYGSGGVSPESVITDENGAALVRWVLGATEDSQALRAVTPNDIAATTVLRTRWAVRSVELDTAGIGVIVDSAVVRVRVRNRLGEVIVRDATTRIETTPDFPDLGVALLERGMLFARGPGVVMLYAASQGVAATPVMLRVAPRFAILASFDQATAGGDTIIARGYRLDLAGEVTIGGTPVATAVVDSATLRVVMPSIDTAACRGGAYVPVALAGGVMRVPGVRVQRAGELALAPGELVRLGAARTGCVRLAPIAGAEYALMYVDTRPIVAAEEASFPTYTAERFDFAVGFDARASGLATSARAPQVATTAHAAGPVDVVRVAGAPAAPRDAIELRATPWQVGDRASVALFGVYESGTIVRVSDPFVVLAVDRNPLTSAELTKIDDALSAVQREAVPMLRAALSDRTPVTSAGSGQFVIVIADVSHYAPAMFFGPGVAITPGAIGVGMITHELAHAWQDRFNRDQCGWDTPFACWSGSTWAVEGGADFLALEAVRRLSSEPLVGSAPQFGSYRACCGPVYSVTFGEGYRGAEWFLRDLVVRAVVGGAVYDSALAAVTRGALEGWYGFAPQRPAGAAPREGLARRLTALLGTSWHPVDAFETSVWSLGMDESAAPVLYQYLAYRDYHFGRVGTIGEPGHALAGPIAGDTFGHVQLEDRGAGGAYRYSVASDGFVWAIGRVR